MPGPPPYIELQNQSRGYSVTTNSVSQTFVYKICNMDTDEIDAGTEFGSFFSPNDDAGIAQYVYSTFPVFRTFPVTVTENIILYLTSHSGQEQDGSWIITLTYTVPPLNQAQGSYIQFGIELGGETDHVSKSLSIRNSVARSGSALTPPVTNGAIGITKDKITGADIIGKGFNFNITTYYTAALWTITILTTLYKSQATTNNALFNGFAAGEVLLASVSAQGEQYKIVPVTFSFSAKENANAIADSPFPALTALGHDQIDYLYTKDVNANFPIQVPAYRYVHQVYQTSDFTILGV